MHEVKVNKFRFIPTTCMLCGSDNHRDHYVIDKYEQGKLYFVRCNHCGTRYQNPMPDQPSMAEFYHSQSFFSAKASSGPLTGYQDYDAQENIRHINARKRLAEIEGLFPAKKKLRILKVACGYGTLVKLARNCGHDAEGIDFSDVMVKGAKQRYDIDLIHADFLEYDFGDRTYDAVLLYGAINNFLRPLDVAQKAPSVATQHPTASASSPTVAKSPSPLTPRCSSTALAVIAPTGTMRRPRFGPKRAVKWSDIQPPSGAMIAIVMKMTVVANALCSSPIPRISPK